MNMMCVSLFSARERSEYMLALTRKRGESIMIGDNVEIVILGISGEQVKLGCIAPKSIAIHRKEIFEQIKQENLEAASNAGNIDISGISALIIKK
jgi:carbon storage regulator